MNSTTPTKLWNKNFITYIIGLELNQIATALLQFSLPLYLLIQTGNPILLSTILTISALPPIITSPIGGVVADKFNKRKMMAGVNVLIALITIAYIGFAQALDFVLSIVILLMLLESFVAFMSPATEAVVPILVPEEDLMKANSVNFLLSIFSGVGAPLIAGFMMERQGILPVLVLSIVFYIIAGGITYLTEIPFEKQEIIKNIFALVGDDLKDGFLYVIRENKTHRKILMSSTLFMLVFGPIIGLILPVLVTNYFNMGETSNGVIRSIVVFGASFSVILGGRLGKKANIYKLRQLIFYSSFALIPSIISFGLFGDGIISLILLIASLFVVWTLLTLYLLVLWTYIGSETPYEIMGKVFSLFMALTALGPILSNHLFGILLDYFIDNPYFILGVIAGAGALVAVITNIKEEKKGGFDYD